MPAGISFAVAVSSGEGQEQSSDGLQSVTGAISLLRGREGAQRRDEEEAGLAPKPTTARVRVRSERRRDRPAKKRARPDPGLKPVRV